MMLMARSWFSTSRRETGRHMHSGSDEKMLSVSTSRSGRRFLSASFRITRSKSGIPYSSHSSESSKKIGLTDEEFLIPKVLDE